MHLRKRVLVTGGAGFLGSHLCERLLDAGCDVLCAENFYTGAKRNIVHLLDNPYSLDDIRDAVLMAIFEGLGANTGSQHS